MAPKESTTNRGDVELSGVTKDDASFANVEIALPSELAGLTNAQLESLKRWAVFKLDLRIMPAVFMMFFLNYLDRQNIASAKLANIQSDLHMTDVQYQTCVSLLFVGYILMQVPSNMLAGKIAYPAVYICLAMATWGIISACTAAVQNFAGLVSCRFFLGFVEAAFLPGVIYYMSLFYSRQQMALRTAILWSGSMVGNAFGGLFAIGILGLDGKRGLEGWRWLFLIEGTLTIFFALAFALIMPNQLHGMKGFTPEEQEYLYWNFGKDQGQQDDREEMSPAKGALLAITDKKLWMLMGTLWSTYICAASLNFFPSVVSTLGYSRNTTLALTAPPSILCVPVMLINGWHSDKKRERFIHVTWPLVMCLISMIIAVSTLNTGARYFAMMLMPASFYGSATVIFSWVTGTISQPAAKRAAAIAIINAVCNTPNVWTPYLYFGAPRYTVAFIVNCIAAGLACSFSALTYLYLKRQNAKLDRGEDLGKHGPTVAQVASGYRYIL